MKLSLVIPCYNEEKTLAACVEKTLALKNDSLDLELIIVDDGSRDTSLEIAYRLAAVHPEVRVIRHEVNRGKGAALRTGLMEATGNFVGIQDADAEYDPRDYAKLLQPILHDKADVVYGSRYLRPESRRVLYFWHSTMNHVLTFCSNAFTDLGITDMETCYKLFTRDVIRSIAPQLKENRFGFEPEVTQLVAEHRCRVYECAISYNPRTYEEGKKIGWKDGVRALYCIFHYGAHRAPAPVHFLIYLFIGGISALVNIGLFAALYGPLALLLATVIAFFAAAFCNYLLCIALLFKHLARFRLSGELLIYFTGVSLLCGLDFVITACLIMAGVGSIAAKAVATAIGLALNYFFRKKIVFLETGCFSRQDTEV